LMVNPLREVVPVISVGVEVLILAAVVVAVLISVVVLRIRRKGRTA
jgi:hypothetical protein